MSNKRICPGCGKEPPQYLNYCNWNCGIEAAKKAGGKIYTPNGLPIRCIKHDSTMLEHEHGDHPDYKFPVEVVYLGTRPKMYDWERSQTHALIYTDGSIAITMYECCYAMWYMGDGAFAGGSLWKRQEWKLPEVSLKKIREYHGKKISK